MTGGETWFPRAHGGPVPWDEWTACDDRGIKMGNTSVAILFYSLYSSGEPLVQNLYFLDFLGTHFKTCWLVCLEFVFTQTLVVGLP